MGSDDERVALRSAELILAHHRRAPAQEAAPTDDVPSSAVVIKVEGKPEDIQAATDLIQIEDGEIVG
jgi:hypothetical protein